MNSKVVRINPVNRVLLKGVLLFSFLYRRMGVDVSQLKSILRLKLTLDDRRATGVFRMNRNNDSRQVRWATLFTMLLSLILGSVFLVAFSLGDDITRLTAYFNIMAFMMAMLLITDLSSLLFNTADNYILLPKPISSITFITARFLHIIIHLLKIAIPLTFPAWLYIFFSKGLLPLLAFILGILLITTLIFCLVNFLYLLLIRSFNAQRINSILTTFQITLTIIFYAAYFSINYFIDDVDFNVFTLRSSPWLWIFPGYWIANMWILLTLGAVSLQTLSGTLLSFLVPLLTLSIIFKYLAPAFLRKLAEIGPSTGPSLKHSNQSPGIYNHKKTISAWLAPLFSGNMVERSSFMISWKITSRYRDFKLKVYPGIGYLIVVYAVMIIRNIFSNDLPQDYTQHMILILAGIYFIPMLYTTAIIRVAYHDQFKAAWIWHSAPLAGPGNIISGAIKASLVKFYLLPMIALTFCYVYLFGINILPNVVFGASNVLLFCAIYSWPAMDKLPFSVSPNISADGKNTFRMMFIFIIMPVLAIPHYFISHLTGLLWILSILVFGISLIIIQTTKKIRWSYLDPETE